MHGCGVRIWRDSSGAYRSASGKFFSDDYVGPVMGCSEEGAQEAAVEADIAAAMARQFQVVGRARFAGDFWVDMALNSAKPVVLSR